MVCEGGNCEPMHPLAEKFQLPSKIKSSAQKLAEATKFAVEAASPGTVYTKADSGLP